MFIIRVEIPFNHDINKPLGEDCSILSGQEIMDMYIKSGLIPKEFIYANDPRIEDDKFVFEIMIASEINTLIKMTLEKLPIEGSNYELLFDEHNIIKE